MNARKLLIVVSLLMIGAMLMPACSPAAMPTAAPPQALYDRSANSAAPPAAAPTTAPVAQAQPTQPAAPAAPSAPGDKTAPGAINASPFRQTRMIIKNGEMSLMVADPDRAIDLVTGVAVNSGGYIVSAKTWLQDGFKYAQMRKSVV